MTPIMTIGNKFIQSHVLGFPRGKDTVLDDGGAMQRVRHWAQQRAAGLDVVTVGDLIAHDRVADHGALFGCPPGKETAPWFDTDDDYQVPTFAADTAFALAGERLLAQVAQAHALGHPVKAVLLGPLTFLWLGRETGNDTGFSRLDLIDRLLPAYGALLDRLKAQGVTWVQIDEPILGLDLPGKWRNAFEAAYWQLNQVGIQLLLATYFSPLKENLGLACRLPIAGLHVDGVRAPHELTSIADWLPVHKVLSIGMIDGGHAARTNLDQALTVLAPIVDKRGGKLWVSASCSLLHLPTPATAADKLAELAQLKQSLLAHALQAAAEPAFV
jgi:5-methyltetrahydropteroyltriglutamate--homocysteine methyltransferase